ncbi:MAG: hypothetical protein II926_01490 [Bacteroidales bacterium]|nr:hypothetical protein [Bacteroidales bacterium]
MKKSVLIILSSMICLFGYSTNIPKVNNHGFPQNIKTTPKEIILEQVSENKQAEDVVATPVKAKKQSVQKKRVSAPKNDVSKVVVEEKTIAEQDVKPVSKKELKKTLKDTKKPAKSGKETLSIVAFVLSLTFPIVGLILGYVAKGHDGKNIWNKLAIIFGWIFTAFILLYFVGYVVLLSILLA